MDSIDSAILLAKGGDDAAISMVMAHALEFLSGFIDAHISSNADADDVAQDALIAVADNLDVFDSGRGVRFDDWLSGIARIHIARYQANEYVCGRRKGGVKDGVIPYPFRESLLGSDEDEIGDYEDANFADGEGPTGPRDELFPIRYSLEARREMEEAEKAFRGD